MKLLTVGMLDEPKEVKSTDPHRANYLKLQKYLIKRSEQTHVEFARDAHIPNVPDS